MISLWWTQGVFIVHHCLAALMWPIWSIHILILRDCFTEWCSEAWQGWSWPLCSALATLTNWVSARVQMHGKVGFDKAVSSPHSQSECRPVGHDLLFPDMAEETWTEEGDFPPSSWLIFYFLTSKKDGLFSFCSRFKKKKIALEILPSLSSWISHVISGREDTVALWKPWALDSCRIILPLWSKLKVADDKGHSSVVYILYIHPIRSH